MNPALQAAIVAAHSTETVDTVVAKLKKAGALSPEQAVRLDDTKEEVVAEAVTAGLIIKNKAGLFYVDEQAVKDRSESQGLIVIVVLLIMASIAASAIALVIAS